MTNELIANIAFSVIIAALAVYVAKLRSDKKRIFVNLAKSELDKMILQTELEKALANKDAKGIEQTEGFLKFVSDSRDWAFSYIETVQSGLAEFTSKAGPEIKLLGTYAKTSEPSLDNAITRISDAYKDLESLLPSEDKEK